MKVNCPLCSGSGKIEAPQFKQKFLEEKVRAAKKLRKRGHSIREIMRAMKYKSTRSVVNLLEK